jgi:hypothetical protein
LLPIPSSQPGSGIRSGLAAKIQPHTPPANISTEAGNSVVNIKILPGLPTSGLPTPATTQTNPALDQDKGTVQVKMQDSAVPMRANSAVDPLSTSFMTSAVTVTTSTPLTIENGKAQGSGPVKLNIGDSGIVDLGAQRPRQETTVTSRTPELVKPKKYSISQSVVLAQAAEIQPHENAPPSLKAEPDQAEPRLLEPNLPALLPDMSQADKIPAREFQPKNDSDQLPQDQIQNEKQTGINEPQIAYPNSLMPPNSSRSAAVASVSPALPITPIKSVEPAASQTELALRQHALRNQPEKTYDIESRGTYSIDTPFLVAAAASLDSNICTVFNNGNSITIAGGSTGNTRVAIASQTGETRLIEVNVLPVGQQFSRPQSEIDQVKELIGKVFPDARVQIVSLPTGEVEVKGVTSTESDARKILELVRKVCLVPVHDRLKSGR